MSIVQGRKIWVAQFDLSGFTPGLAFQTTLETQDDTVLPDTFRSNVTGLETFSVEKEGIWSIGAGQPDTVFAAHKGLADLLTTLAIGSAEGSIAYFFRVTQGEYALGGSVGDLLRYSLSLQASGGRGAVRGTLMQNGSEASTGSGTARQLGAVSASQFLHAGLHVISGTGTLDVRVQSDNAEGFPSATTRITFGQKTEAASELATPVAGAISDDWWRIDWTIGTGPFDFVVGVGIQ